MTTPKLEQSISSITIDVQEPGETVFVETFYPFYKTGYDAVSRALHIAREVERLFVAYPSATVINITIEKERNGPEGAAHIQQSRGG
jgi:hypothetical protein